MEANQHMTRTLGGASKINDITLYNKAVLKSSSVFFPETVWTVWTWKAALQTLQKMLEEQQVYVLMLLKGKISISNKTWFQKFHNVRANKVYVVYFNNWPKS